MQNRPNNGQQSAQWIAPPGSESLPNYYFRARRRFTLGAVPAALPVHVAAESLYQFRVNGQWVGQGPARGTRALNFFDTFDVAGLLRAGENELSVLVRCDNIPTFKASPARPALWMQAEGLDISTDERWQVQQAPEFRADVPLYTLQIGHMEWRDLRLEASDWQPAEVVSDGPELAGKRLLPRDVSMLRVSHDTAAVPVAAAAVPPLTDPQDTAVARIMTEEAHVPLALDTFPLTLPPIDGGFAFVLDFGREITGGLLLELDAPAGTIVDVGYEEEMHNGRLTVLHDQYAFADRFLLREGRQIVGPTVAERGFRMAQIVLRGFSQTVTVHKAEAEDRRYAAPPPAKFECSDPLLNALWASCAETLSACTTDVFIDCPWRESAFWVNDLLVENVTWLQAFGDPRVNARALRLAFSERRFDGLVPGVCPTSDDQKLIFPVTNLFLSQIVEEYLLYTGDERLVEELLISLQAILTTIAAWVDADGLITAPAQFWNFVDWGYSFKAIDLGGRKTAVLNWFYVSGLAATARLLRRRGQTAGAQTLEEKASRTATAIDAAFWDTERQVYAEWRTDTGFSPESSQLAHAVALLSGHLPKRRHEAAAAALTRDDILAPELYLSHLVFRAMTLTGQSAAVWERIQRFWGPMIAAGSPTIWEANVYQHGKSAFSGAGSLCHGFATTPIDFLQTVALGVRPTAPGFAEFTVAPQTLGLEFAAGTVPTPAGPIAVAWRQQSNGYTLTLTAPPGTKAHLPDGSVFEGGTLRAVVTGGGGRGFALTGAEK